MGYSQQHLEVSQQENHVDEESNRSVPKTIEDSLVQTKLSILKNNRQVTFKEDQRDVSVKPFHERLKQYNQIRQRIFSDSVNNSRSAERGRKYWNTVKHKQQQLVSTIVNLDDDVRPYASVVIIGKTVLGLLDSGASISCIGSSLCQEIISNGGKINNVSASVNTADGRKQNVLGTVQLYIKYKQTSKLLEFYLIPSLKQDLYLGINFWKEFKIAPEVISEISTAEPLADVHELSSSEKAQLEKVVKIFPSFENKGLGKTTLVEHTIEVGDAKPIKQRYFPVSPAIQRLMCEEIDRMLSMGVIEESSSPWSSPVVLVRKPGKVRLCLDSRKLNEVTIKDAYPLPHIDGILSRLPQARFISSLDLKDAFWQIPLEKSAREKTAFTIPNRPLYQYTVMPFGLCNAPQTMCRLMDRVIPYYLKDRVFVYLDDLLLISEDFSSHLELLQEVALHITKAGLTLNIRKSKFCLKQVKYLGYVVGHGTLQTDPDKVSAIVEFPAPKTVKQLRRFLGLAGWYRRFISNFAEVSSPLTELLKKKRTFDWTEEANMAFKTLKEKLSTAPVLTNPDYAKPFLIQCDASQHGVGAVIAQVSEEGEETPIAYMSQKLNKAQRNYSVTEQECLAAVLAIKKFRAYVEGHEFTLITDHASLKWLMRQTDLNGRLARWALKLQGFKFNIEHRKGSANVVPDALSRTNEENVDEIATFELENCPELDLTSSEFENESYTNLRKTLLEEPDKYPDFKVSDKYIYYRTQHYRGDIIQEENTWKLYVPEGLRETLIKNNHDQPNCAHGGVYKTVDRIRRFYYWPHMYNEIKTFITNCEVCKTTKHTTKITRPPMGNFTPVERIFQWLYIDFIGPLPRSRNGHIGILVVLDKLSKFTFLFPVRNFKTASVIKLLQENVFSLVGVPEVIHSDNGSQFRAGEFQSFLTKLGVKQVFTAIYSPQSNSSERVNRSINAALRAYIKKDQKDWDLHLSEINSALRSMYHQSIGCSPYLAVFGQNMITHGETYQVLRNISMLEEGLGDGQKNRSDFQSEVRMAIKKNLQKAHNLNEKTYNLRARPIQYKVGEQILCRNFAQSNLAKNFNAKLARPYLKATVKEKIGNSYYVLINGNGKQLGTYHAKDLRKF